jgi:hypothetical protein
VWDSIAIRNLELSPTTSVVAFVPRTIEAIEVPQCNSIALDLEMPTNAISLVQQNKKFHVFFKEGNTT